MDGMIEEKFSYVYVFYVSQTCFSPISKHGTLPTSLALTDYSSRRRKIYRENKVEMFRKCESVKNDNKRENDENLSPRARKAKTITTTITTTRVRIAERDRRQEDKPGCNSAMLWATG